jgi:CRP-like cAMP-binding protein
MADAKERRIGELGLFRECGTRDIEWIARHADEIDVRPTSVLAGEGTFVRELLVVEDGVASDGSVVYGPGSAIGAPGLLTGRRNDTTIAAVSRVRVLVFGVGAFRGLIARVPSVRAALAAALPTPQESPRLRAVS